MFTKIIKTSGRNGHMTSFKLQYKNENDQYIDLNNGSPYNFSTLPTATVESTTEDILFEAPIFAKVFDFYHGVGITLYQQKWVNY